MAKSGRKPFVPYFHGLAQPTQLPKRAPDPQGLSKTKLKTDPDLKKRGSMLP